MLIPAEKSADNSTDNSTEDDSTLKTFFQNIWEDVKDFLDSDEESTAGETVASFGDPGAFVDEPDPPLILEIHIDFLEEEVSDCSGVWCDGIIG